MAPQEKCADRMRGRTAMASSGLTRVALHAGMTEAASDPPSAQMPESTMHQKPSDTPIGKKAGRKWFTISNNPQPASRPPPQPTSPSNRLSMAIMAPTCTFVSETARSMANWRMRSSTPILSVVKMMNSAAKSEMPVADNACPRTLSDRRTLLEFGPHVFLGLDLRRRICVGKLVGPMGPKLADLDAFGQDDARKVDLRRSAGELLGQRPGHIESGDCRSVGQGRAARRRQADHEALPGHALSLLDDADDLQRELVFGPVAGDDHVVSRLNAHLLRQTLADDRFAELRVRGVDPLALHQRIGRLGRVGADQGRRFDGTRRHPTERVLRREGRPVFRSEGRRVFRLVGTGRFLCCLDPHAGLKHRIHRGDGRVLPQRVDHLPGQRRQGRILGAHGQDNQFVSAQVLLGQFPETLHERIVAAYHPDHDACGSDRGKDRQQQSSGPPPHVGHDQLANNRKLSSIHNYFRALGVRGSPVIQGRQRRSRHLGNGPPAFGRP